MRPRINAPLLDPTGNPFPWLLSPVLFIQGMWVRSRTPRMTEAAGPREGRCGSGPDMNLYALGDSIVAGVGVDITEQALPAQLARALADRLGCQVRWFSQGNNGARTSDLLRWELGEAVNRAGLVVISNGLNDVTSLMAMRPWLEQKRQLFDRIFDAAPKALVAQLGLPPLGHFPALPNPLRWVLGRRAEAFDRALEEMIQEFPRVVYLPFRSVPDPSLFAEDGYHPGPEAVAIWARSLAGMLGPQLMEAEQKG